MEPTFKAGTIIIASGLRTPQEQDTVVINHDGLEKIKRLEKLESGKVFVVGDNAAASTDSRQFGWLDEAAIIAKVIWPRRRTIKLSNRKDTL